jgi:hypothetical protein
MLLVFGHMPLCDFLFCAHAKHASAPQAMGVSVSKSGNDALSNNLLHALFYILSINALISIFSEAEVFISIRCFGEHQ